MIIKILYKNKKVTMAAIICDVDILKANLNNIPDKYLDIIVTIKGSAIFSAVFKTVNNMPPHPGLPNLKIISGVWEELSEKEKQPFEDSAQKRRNNGLTILKSSQIDEGANVHFGNISCGSGGAEIRALLDKYAY